MPPVMPVGSLTKIHNCNYQTVCDGMKEKHVALMDFFMGSIGGNKYPCLATEGMAFM